MKTIRRMRSEYEDRTVSQEEPGGVTDLQAGISKQSAVANRLSLIGCHLGQCPRLLWLGLGTRQRRTIMARCHA